MASLARVVVARFSSQNGIKTILVNKQNFNLVRSISSKLLRNKDDCPPRPPPYKYREKRYHNLINWYDKTTSRMDENSKVIIVEGPIAAGKSKFAKELAEELDMFYFPEANLNMHYVNEYGFDLRKLDDQVPESLRSFDIPDFLLTPKHRSTALFQLLLYTTRYSQYVDALAYLFNTGQGVVLDRSCYSDFVFVEAMYSQGYLSKQAYKYYYQVRDQTIPELLRPHLIIYLDIPVKKVQENIKNRCLQCEKNSQVLTSQYLGVMEKYYKQHYLKQMSKNSELLIYDWSEGGDVEVAVEDIERIEFVRGHAQDPKFKDWSFDNEEDWGVARYEFTRKWKIMSNFNIPMFDVPELSYDPEEVIDFYDIMEKAPGEKYKLGYNRDMGDTGILFKTAHLRPTLRLIERELK